MKGMRFLMPSLRSFSHRFSLDSSLRELERRCGFHREYINKHYSSLKNGIRRYFAKWHQERDDHGYTTIELIIVLGIIAIIGSAVFSLSAASIRATSEAHKNMRKAALLLCCDSVLRKHILAVRVPFCGQDIAIAHDYSSISVPYYQGEKNHTLTIFRESRMIMLKAGEVTISLPGVEYIDATVLLGKAGENAGLIIVYRIDGTEYRTIAAFGETAMLKRRW